MADIRIKDLPSIVGPPSGAEFVPTDDAVSGTRKLALSALATYVASTLPPPSGGSADFVFQPGGAPGGNIYTAWNLLLADAGAVPAGVPKRIFFDGSYNGGACVVPPGGVFLFGEFQLVGVTGGGGASARPTVTFSDRCTFNRWPSLVQNLLINDLNTAVALFDGGGAGGSSESLLVYCAILASAGQPLFRSTIPGANPSIFLARSTIELVLLLDTLALPTSASVFVTNGSVLGQNTIASNPQALIVVDASSRAESLQSASASTVVESEWSSQSTFVFDPTATPPLKPNVFNDWAALHSMINTISGFITIIFPVDCTVPNTIYDFDRQVVRWLGGGNIGGGGIRPTVTGALNAQVLGLRIAEEITLRCIDGAAPGGLLRSPTGAIGWRYDFINADIEPLQAVDSVVYHDQAGGLRVRFWGQCQAIFGGGAPAIIATGVGSLTVDVYDESVVDGSAITTPALYVASLRTQSPAAAIGPQPTMLGITTLNVGANANRVTYTPTPDAASWVLPNPTTTDQAIARLAVAVQGLLGGQIP